MSLSQRLDTSVLQSYEIVSEAKLQPLLAQAAAQDRHKIIVLDDDPTGVQTVHDIYVYTDWSYESLCRCFDEEAKVVYILTNSRGMTEAETRRVHEEIGERILCVSKEKGQPFLLVSRSDSTLRGHYPLETSLLREKLEAGGQTVDGEILCPYFKEGGRFTIDNVHYVKYGNELVPAGQTEFAQDKTFGYSSSDLTEYIEEKSQGIYKKESVVTIALKDLRACRYEQICQQLMAVNDFQKVVVNAIDACDVKVFTIALYQALAQGKYFLFRTAAGLVKELGAIENKALLKHDEMVLPDTTCGGIVVIGSHTQKTTSQLEALRDLTGLQFIEFNSDLVLEPTQFAAEIDSVLSQEEAYLAQGKTVIVYTKRQLLTLENDTKEAALKRSVAISEAVQSLVGRLQIIPAFVVAKGGITSSDIGTKALRVKRAKVLGQIQPGIPVWQTDGTSKFPHMPYVIFPGNVGEPDT